jgi:hypothetical protein
MSNDPYLSAINVSEAGLMRLCSFIIAFLFWQFLFLLGLTLELTGQVHFQINALETKLSPLFQVCSFLGIAPIMIVVLSWKIIELFVSTYLNSYRKKYLIFTKNGNPV